MNKEKIKHFIKTSLINIPWIVRAPGGGSGVSTGYIDDIMSEFYYGLNDNSHFEDIIENDIWMLIGEFIQVSVTKICKRS